MFIRCAVLAVAAMLLTSCRTAPTAGWDARLWTARATAEVRWNWTQEQVLQTLGPPQKAIGPLQLNPVDTLLVWTYYLPKPGTPLNASRARVEYDEQNGVWLLILNGRLLRRARFGQWDAAATEAASRPRGPKQVKTLDQLQSEWAEDVQHERDLAEKLDLVQQELLKSSQEKLPTVTPGDKVAPRRGHSGAYVTVGR